MNYERINDTTLKIYISYIDIEERGFNPDEIWFSREKSEQLFWEMMDEVEEMNPFDFEGPLWIQVHAVDKGIEVVVSKPELSQDGKSMDYPGPLAKVMAESENFFDQDDYLTEEERSAAAQIAIYRFADFDHLIPLSKRLAHELMESKLFKYESDYYLAIDYSSGDFVEDHIANCESILLEFAEPSNKTIHILEEYGTVIIDHDVFATITHYF